MVLLFHIIHTWTTVHISSTSGSKVYLFIFKIQEQHPFSPVNTNLFFGRNSFNNLTNNYKHGDKPNVAAAVEPSRLLTCPLIASCWLDGWAMGTAAPIRILVWGGWDWFWGRCKSSHVQDIMYGVCLRGLGEVSGASIVHNKTKVILFLSLPSSSVRDPLLKVWVFFEPPNNDTIDHLVQF